MIIVHTKTLLEQWRDRIETFLDVPKEQIGVIGGGKIRISNQITVATVQSLYKIADQVKENFGHVICDEVHHCPSRTFSEAVSAFDSKYILGLSATPYRRDKLTRMIGWYVGDTAHRIGQKELAENGAILPFKVRWVKTGYRTRLDPSSEYSRMLSELTQDPERNRIVCQEAAQQANNGGGIPIGPIRQESALPGNC